MKLRSGWYSHRLDLSVNVVRWGTWGQPVLLFPTAGGDAEEVERFQLLRSLKPLLDNGKIKVYSVDSVAGRAWLDGALSGREKAAAQTRFDQFIYREVVPAIWADCGGQRLEIVAAGASIGAFNALASLCRHPDVFRAAICMSGTYDLTRWIGGEQSLDFHYCSPLHFIPTLPDGHQLQALRSRFILVGTGEGRWEAPEESRRVGHVLGAKGIPNRVDFWGKDKDHDWATWRDQLPRYLWKLVEEGKL